MFITKNNQLKSLLNEVQKLKNQINNEKHPELNMDTNDLDPMLKEVVEGFMQTIDTLYVNYEEIKLKYDLVVEAGEIGVWDINVVDGTPIEPNIYSNQVRQLLGYSNEMDFPNVMESWTSSLHPDDTARVFHAYGSHLSDGTGETPFVTELRGKMKNGEYRWFKSTAKGLIKEGNMVRRKCWFYD